MGDLTGSAGGLPPTTDTTPSPAATQLQSYKGFEISGRVASKKVTIDIDGTKKTFNFKVHFPAGKKEILDQFSEEKVKLLIEQARDLGLGEKFKQISMTFEKDQMKEIKGTRKKDDAERTLTEDYLSKKVTKYAGKYKEALKNPLNKDEQNKYKAKVESYNRSVRIINKLINPTKSLEETEKTKRGLLDEEKIEISQIHDKYEELKKKELEKGTAKTGGGDDISLKKKSKLKTETAKESTPSVPYVYEINDKTGKAIREELIKEILKKPALSKLSFPEEYLGKTDDKPPPFHLKPFKGLTEKQINAHFVYEAAKRVQDLKGPLKNVDKKVIEEKLNELRTENNELWKQAIKLVEKSGGDSRNESLILSKYEALKKDRILLWKKATESVGYTTLSHPISAIESKYAELVKEDEKKKLKEDEKEKQKEWDDI